MDGNIEKECSALGGLFQAIVNDLKGSTPIWEDFLSKATKLHHTLRATILAASAFLDTFQKVADMATNTKGATRELGSALTRLCMRHRSIEGKLKAFTTAIMEVMVNPMQERMEDWKRHAGQLDKDHAKEYKKAKAEIKRASSDTIRLQKKVKKGKTDTSMQNKLDSALSDVNDKYLLLEETEKNAVRQALIEERGRFCVFISCLKPVVDEEIAMLTEVTHLQEIMDSLCMQASDPSSLPSASEQVILDIKGGDSWSFQMPDQSPPSSPGSLGSRKSSMCSISSLNSSSSGSSKSHSPSHHYRQRTPSQQLMTGTVRLTSVSSQDSGFMSQDTLFLKPPSPATSMDLHRKMAPPAEEQEAELEQEADASEPNADDDKSLNKSSDDNDNDDTDDSVSEQLDSSLQDSGSGTGTDSGGTTPSPSYPNATSASTWSNWPDPPLTSQQVMHTSAQYERPHTISTAYERQHARPALTAQTFEPPENKLDRPPIQTSPNTPSHYAVPCIIPPKGQPSQREKIYDAPQIYDCPKIYDSGKIYAPAPGPKPRGKAVAPPMVPNFNQLPQDQMIPAPTYVNMNDLASLAVQKQRERLHVHPEEGEHNIPPPQQPPPPQPYPGPASMMAPVGAPTSHYHAPHHLLWNQEPIYQHAVRKQPRSASVPPQQKLSRVIAELSEHTAAMRRTSSRSGSPQRKASSTPASAAGPEAKAPNSQELADAIRELEMSTIELQMSYDTPQQVEPPMSHDASNMQVVANGCVGPPEGATPKGPLGRDEGKLAKKPPLKPRPLSTTGMPQGPGLRRNSSYCGPMRPTPPVRRSSSITGVPPNTLPIMQALAEEHDRREAERGRLEHRGLQDGQRSGSTTPTPQGSPEYAPNGMTTPTDKVTFNNDDDFDLPPPPPELLNPEPDPYIQHPGIQRPLQRMPSVGSVNNSHAAIIQNLNAQLAARTSIVNNVSSRPTDLPGQNMTPHRRYSLDDADITPTAEAPNTLMSQIRRGVRLRKTISHDRSAPKLQ